MKNLLKLTFLVVVFIVVWQYSSVKKPSQVSSLILQNIEALADDNESGGAVFCVGSGSVDCPFLESKVEYVITGYGL